MVSEWGRCTDELASGLVLRRVTDSSRSVIVTASVDGVDGVDQVDGDKSACFGRVFCHERGRILRARLDAAALLRIWSPIDGRRLMARIGGACWKAATSRTVGVSAFAW